MNTKKPMYKKNIFRPGKGIVESIGLALPFVLPLMALNASPHLGHSLNLPFEAPGTVDAIVGSTGVDFPDHNITDRTSFSSDLATFFENLYTYSPENSHGSCGYVSLIQYMSYFDTFYNDLIIPDNYDQRDGTATTSFAALQTSPGVLRATYPSPGMALYLYCTQNDGCDFQAKLMRIHNRNLSSGISFSAGIHMNGYQDLFDNLYSPGKVNYSYHSYSEYSTSPDNPVSAAALHSYVTQVISEGFPVILHIGHFNSITGGIEDYHSVVAYDFDDDDIYCNFGWGSNQTHLGLNDYVITEAGVADFSDFGHVHSHNYVVDGVEYCGCGVHYHDYLDHYVSANPYYHFAYCSCGQMNMFSHGFYTVEGVGSVCRYCGYVA